MNTYTPTETSANDPNIISAVNPVAQKYGVPTGIWEAVVQVESGGDPNAVGDNGTSYGLFQLHKGGQLGNLTEAQAFNPTTNAQAAMPSIAAALNQLRGDDPNTPAFWRIFAATSGHPGMNGNTSDPAVIDEGDRLYTAYEQMTGQSGGATTINTPTVTLSDPYGQITGGAENALLQPLINAVQSFFSGAGVKIGLFMLGILLLIIGLIVLFHKAAAAAASSAVNAAASAKNAPIPGGGAE